MPSHEINLHFPRPLEIINTDAVIEVRADGKHLGDLKVSRGSIDWRPSQSQTSRWLEWEAFDQLMETEGKR